MAARRPCRHGPPPCLVVIENVRGLLTSPAGSPGDVERCPWCLGDTAGQPALRALGAVFGSLADLGYDAKWLVLRASDVGAPHRRERTFLAAWSAGHPAEDADQQHREERRLAASVEAEERGHAPNLADEVEWLLLPTRKASDGIKGSPNQRHGNGDMPCPVRRRLCCPRRGPATRAPRAADPGRNGGLPCRRWSCLSGRRRRRRQGRGPAMGSVRIRHHPMGEGHPSCPGPHGRGPVGSARTSWSGCRASTSAGSPPPRGSAVRRSSPRSATASSHNRLRVPCSCWPHPFPAVPAAPTDSAPLPRSSGRTKSLILRILSGMSPSHRWSTPHGRHQPDLPRPRAVPRPRRRP